MRRRISLLVVATTSAVVVSFVIPLCLLVRTLAEDRAMAAADQEARNVAILVAGLAGDDAQLAELVAGIDGRGEPDTGVLTADGRHLGSGDDLADDPEVRRALQGEAFTVVDDRGGRVLLPVITEGGTAVVRSQVGPDDLRHGVAGAWTGIITMGALLLAASVAIAWQLGRTVSAPLRSVAATAHRLREGDLDARAAVLGPAETRELAQALNDLADRIAELLATERAAVGDLSHRLRTPVTALRLDSEAVADADLAQRLQTHIGVLQRSIDAIVQEARRPVRADLSSRTPVVATVRERVEFWRPLAEDQGRAMRVDLPGEDAPVALPAQDLADLVDVLVDNVFAHTPEGAALGIALTVAAEEVVLTVSDAGPGLTRGDARREGTTGLGLEIARRTALGWGGRLEVRDGRDDGVVAEVRLPVASP